MSYYRQGPFRPGPPGMQIGVPSLTPYVKILIIANAGIWFFQFVAFSAPFRFDLVRWFGLIPDQVIRGRVWQLGTSMFLHDPQGVWHILFNMLMLWLFGSELERHWGSRGFLRYYLVSGIGAAFFALVVGLASGTGAVPTIGASGAIFGLMIAYGIVFAERTIVFMLIFPMKARTFSWIMLAIAFFSTWSPGGGVSHISHLGGAVTGLLYLKRAWRIGEFVRELKWKFKRRRFKVMPPRKDDFDRWVN